jgi:hypothetical protein
MSVRENVCAMFAGWCFVFAIGLAGMHADNAPLFLIAGVVITIALLMRHVDESKS